MLPPPPHPSTHIHCQVRNAFCAVRPPGHHAGPRGVVPSANDPNGSHGFCLVNNVAAGAAYAMNVHRRAGVKRVAILDFDVSRVLGVCLRQQCSIGCLIYMCLTPLRPVSILIL